MNLGSLRVLDLSDGKLDTETYRRWVPAGQAQPTAWRPGRASEGRTGISKNQSSASSVLIKHVIDIGQNMPALCRIARSSTITIGDLGPGYDSGKLRIERASAKTFGGWPPRFDTDPHM